MIGCKALHDGQELKIDHLFAGFKSKVGPLIGLSLLATGINILVMVVTVGPLFLQLMMMGDPTQMDSQTQEAFSNPMALAGSFVIAMLIMLPVTMAIYFAPALMVLNDVSLIQALKLSFMGSLKNIITIILCLILVSILFTIVAVITLGLGALVLAPMMFALMFVAYKDIFIETNA